MSNVVSINERKLLDLPEKELLDALRTKDEKYQRLAQEEFFYRYRNYIYKVCLDRARYYKKGAELAEDISQDTFVKAFSNLPFVDFSEIVDNEKIKWNIKKWLVTVIKREFVNFFRKNLDEFNVSLSIDDEKGIDVSDEETDQSPPSFHLSLLLEALQELSEKERHILMTYFDYYDWQNPSRHLPDDIMTMLCETHSTNSDNIKHIKLRAIQKLHKKLVK